MAILLTDVSGGFSSFLNILSLIIIFLLVLVLAYFAAKLAAKYQSNVLNSRSNIRVIESFRLGGNKFIAIAKIGENYYAIGIGKDEITFIDKINPDELKNFDSTGESDKKLNFKDILSQVKNKNSKDNNDKSR